MACNKWLLVLTILAVLPAASAFSATYTTLNNSIFKHETASFAITIVNTKGFDDTFQISTRDPRWLLTSDPPLTTIPSISTKSFVLSIKPKQQVELGPHAVPIKVKSVQTGQFREDILLVNLKPETPFGGEYAPAVSLKIDMSEQVSVRENIPITLELDNKNPRDMPELNVVVQSALFNDEETIHLHPLEKIKKEMLFTADQNTKPGVHNFRVKLVLDGITIAEISKDFEVLTYSEISEELEKDTDFFKSTKIFTLSNRGNVEEEAVKRLKIPFYRRLFVSLEPDALKVKLHDGTFYEWRQTLQPGQEVSLTAMENYRFLVLIVVALALIALGYYIFRSPVIIVKKAFVEEVQETKSIFKVRLELKNRSKKHVKKVEIMDKIPNLAEVHKKSDVGSLKPSKVVVSKSKGTTMKWEVEALEPEEERIITYQIKSKLRIIGGMGLPYSRIKFETSDGKERVSYSNKATVMEKE